MSDGPRIVLGEEDFASPAPEPTPAAASPPSLPPIARREPVAIGTPPPPGSAPVALGASVNLLNHPVFAPLIAASIGVLVGWLINEVFGVAEMGAGTEASMNAAAGVWVGVIGVTLGGALLTYDRAFAGAWEDAGRRFAAAALPMAVVGFISGFLANVLYIEIIKQADFEDIVSGSSFVVYLARSVGWAIFGAGIGGMIGVLTKSRDRGINGVVGGAVGGAIGGIVFQFVATTMETSVEVSRLLGLAAVGLLVAFAMRVVEQARRDAWLHINAGGMAGKEFIIYHAATRIGSSPECEIFLLKDPAIDPFHARLDDVGGRRTLTATGNAPVYVNEAPIASQVLRSGDTVRLGQTVIAYSERIVPGAAPQTF